MRLAPWLVATEFQFIRPAKSIERCGCDLSCIDREASELKLNA
jgi:hypothetical protein